MAFTWTILWCLSFGLAPLVHSATDGVSTPEPLAHTGSSQTPAASTPAPPACNAPLPDDHTVSRYRNLSVAEKGRRLLKAAEDGAAGDVRALLAAGADVESRDERWYNWTALHWAAEGGRADAASCLLAGGAEVDARNSWEETPLQSAAARGHTAVVRMLAAASADVNARDVDGRTALHLALRRGRTKVAAALLEAGADGGITDDYGQTPLDIAIWLIGFLEEDRSS